MAKKNKYLVLGSGMGEAIAYQLLQSVDTACVSISDLDYNKAREVAAKLSQMTGGRCLPIRFDINNPYNREIFKLYNVVISALPAKYNVELAKTAIKAGVHFCDLGGVLDVTQEMLKLNELEGSKNISVIPDCGLMPGLGVMQAMHLVSSFDQVRSIKIYVGGIPQRPRPPVYYQRMFSMEGLSHICRDKVPVLENGEVVYKEPFSGYEDDLIVPEFAHFSKFKGRLEAFNTAGASVAPWTFRDLGVINFAESTVRWPVFVDFVRNIPADDFEKVLGPHVNIPVDHKNPDLVFMSVIAKGVHQGDDFEVCTRTIDYFDEITGLTAMQRTTGFPTAIIAEMMANGEIKSRGVNTPETALDNETIDIFIGRVSKVLSIKRVK